MKDFKDYLTEFIIKGEGPGGGGGGGDHYDPIERVKEFMDTVPFRYTTKQGDLIHFDSALDAAHTIAKHLQQHEDGHNHAVQKNVPHMIKYFQKSAATHEDALSLIQDHIVSHQELPPHLREHVLSAVGSIETEEANDHEHNKKRLEGQKDFFGRPSNDIGRRTMSLHHVHPIEIGDEERHPYEFDQGHHLNGVMDEVETSGNPEMGIKSLGYVKHRKREEEQE